VTVTKVLADVESTLANNALIKEFQLERLPYAQKKHAEKCMAAVRTVDYYLKEFNDKDVMHRTWIVNEYLRSINKTEDQSEKWTLRDLKKYNEFLKDLFITDICAKRRFPGNIHVLAGMTALAEYKLELWNRPRYEKAEEPVKLDGFNPGSSKQMKEFFEMCKIAPLAFSKDTGEASWGRDQLKIVEKTVEPMSSLADALAAFLDYSSSAIIKNNFLRAFDKFTVDGVLHGNIKIFGAKSFRNTSNSPNLLNAPSTKSIYAKPLKRCFVAPEDFVIYTADLAALEDRVIANLSGDTNKMNIFLEGLDGHSLNACGYFPEDIAKILGPNTDNVKYVKAFKQAVDDGNEALDKIRFNSKAPTFKLAYGGYPDDHEGGVITQEIFDNYHDVLYPGITDYRENYVLPTTRSQGYLHLGLGCRLYSNDAAKHIRSLNNATAQFWSILTLIAINEFNYRIREDRLEKEVQVISTIYDSIYTQSYRDAEVIEWVNNNLIEVMCVPYLEGPDVVIENEAKGEIGNSWGKLYPVENNASIAEIQAVLEKL
jgi:DNA polymerase-1